MANEENKGYKEFMEFVESATKEQIIDGIYRVIPQMCTEGMWVEIKAQLDELTNTLNYMSQWNRVRELLQDCKEKWNKYDDELYAYECYLKVKKVKERYDAEGGKKGTGVSFLNYISHVSKEETDGIPERMINSAGIDREKPTPPSIFYETMEEVLKETESARQGLKCARMETLRNLLIDLVNRIQEVKDGSYILMDYNAVARRADHKSDSVFRYGMEEVRKKSEELLEELHNIHSTVLERRRRIEQ